MTASATLPTLAGFVPQDRADEGENHDQPRRHEMCGVTACERVVDLAEVDAVAALIGPEAELAAGRVVHSERGKRRAAKRAAAEAQPAKPAAKRQRASRKTAKAVAA